MNLFSDMSWEQMQEYLEHEDRVILPLGATEQHGRHLGLGTDSLEAEAIALGVAQATQVAVMPTMNYGMSHSLLNFPGTISLRPTTLMLVVEDILRTLYRHGFRRVLIVNGHGGNLASITSTVQMVAQDLMDLRIKIFEWWTDAQMVPIMIDKLGPQQGTHASPGETALMMAVRPSGVHLERLTGRNAPVTPSRELTTVNTFPQKYPDGIMGLDPCHVTREAGEAILAKSVEICARELNEWK